jgi:protease-4
MEPVQANYFAGLVKTILKGADMPELDKRIPGFISCDDHGNFRLNADMTVNNASGPIQVLKMNMPIAKYDSCGDPGSQTWMQLISAAEKDSTVASIILWIDSPGGQVDGTESLANKVKNCSKPIIAYIDGMACSAAYWIACGATEVIADGSNNGWNTTIGSIGTMVCFKQSIVTKDGNGGVIITDEEESNVLVFADSSPDKWKDYLDVMGGNYDRIKEELNAINATFIAAVKANRTNIDSSTLTGKTYSAKEAMKFNMIDSLGTFADAVKRAVALSKKSQKTQTTMSTNNVAFQAVMGAINATEIQVVEGGFLLTEEQLNTINARLNTDAELVGAHALAVKDLAAANEQIQTLTGAQTALNEKIANLETENENFAEAAKGFFAGSKGTQDKGGAHEGGAGVESEKFAHNQLADKILN